MMLVKPIAEWHIRKPIPPGPAEPEHGQHRARQRDARRAFKRLAMNLALPRVEFEHAHARAIVLTGGHSGADVVLHTDDSDTWVRKSAATSAGNARLLRQALKQRLFAAQGLAFPRVRELGFDTARHAWFEMDYVPARTLGDLVRSQAAFDRGIVIRAVDELLAKLPA